jgi:hypothetical protein
MKLTLMIEGSPAVIAAVLAALPGGATVVSDQRELPLRPVAQPEPADADDNEPVDTDAPEVDSAGVAWDARIHASSKATVGDGTWRMKRGVDKAIVDVVTAELASQNAPVPMPAVPMPLVEPMPAVPMPLVEPMPAVPMPVAQPEPAPMPVTIPEFMQKLSVQMTGPDAKITNEYLAEAVGKFNAAYGTTFVTVNDFFTAPDKLPALVQMITLDGRW